ncbi:hypothetical protein FHG87_005672 [Trinorchestia longiramus]|nr:hypothetical protein FHG87_005672 [Trinorchestia longiramus]
MRRERGGLGLVYGQVVAEVQHGWLLVTSEQHDTLAQLQARGQKREYLELARTFKYYGSVQFSRCLCDFPAPNTVVTIAAGCNELNFRIDGEDGLIKEGSFKVTRMRCWRISTHQTSPEMHSPSSDLESSPGSSSQALTDSRQNSTASNSSGFGSNHSLCSSSSPRNTPDSALPPLHKDTVRLDGAHCEQASSSSKQSSSIRGSQSTATQVVSGSSSLTSPTNGFGNGANIKEAADSHEDITSRTMKEFLSRSDTAELGAILELSFEYLLRAGELRWVRVLSNQAVLMSLCLQSMVQQLLSSSSGTFPSPPPCPAVTELPIQYTKTDGSSVLVYTHNVRQPRNSSAGLSALGELSLRRLTEKFADLNGSSSSSHTGSSDSLTQQQQQQQQQVGVGTISYQQLTQHVVENSAFNNITDQHL